MFVTMSFSRPLPLEYKEAWYIRTSIGNDVTINRGKLRKAHLLQTLSVSSKAKSKDSFKEGNILSVFAKQGRKKD